MVVSLCVSALCYTGNPSRVWPRLSPNVRWSWLQLLLTTLFRYTICLPTYTFVQIVKPDDANCDLQIQATHIQIPLIALPFPFPKTSLAKCLTQATFKRYQSEHKLKQDTLDRSQTDLKKLRRKSQGKNSSKYTIRENEVRLKQNSDLSISLSSTACTLHGFSRMLLLHGHALMLAIRVGQVCNGFDRVARGVLMMST